MNRRKGGLLCKMMAIVMSGALLIGAVPMNVWAAENPAPQAETEQNMTPPAGTDTGKRRGGRCMLLT